MSLKENLRNWARRLKRDGVALWFASRHPGTPFAAKLLSVFVVAYALSPIDLVPDFIPVFGYVDDVLLLPALIWLAIRLIPEDVMGECRRKSEEWMAREGSKPRSRWGAVLIVAIWLAVAYAAWRA
ncbi:YkvA family protein [Noviherbaspirillum denitrificans]|uniref:DUF1232 domain-containing protein n=1 Tax=Noviherbaspirillum denitrificans TaxID=1968433 RepID=A0A254TKC2_9BURK|nr:YkvA family protein [Noviherbaspirillum denitrificans]OWW23069.1 hypothetical protein AYR66_25740 [Noviherbaspirillum denitrificans]